MNTPQVVVACAWYNRADYIGDTLDSLLNQDFDGFEIVIVNDGSTDPRVKEILDTYDDPRLRVIHQENTGFTGAIRRAVEASNAPYIAIQGAGDVSLPSRLRRQWEAFHAEPELGICGCKVSNATVEAGIVGPEQLQPVKMTQPRLKDLTGSQNPFTHGGVMFNRRIYDAVGGYRPFFLYAQDRDLWLRMARSCRLQVIDAHLYQRRNFAEDGVSTSLEKTLLQERFSTLAIQCHLERIRDGTDCVSRYGNLAGLFRRPSPIAADTFARLAVKEMQFGTLEKADRLLEMARQEGTTGLTVVAWVMRTLCAVPMGRSLLQALLKNLSKRSPLR
jgi:hypothetical protein